MGVIKGSEIATIDVALVSIQSYEDGADEIILDTSNKIDVTAATETEDAIKLIVKGRLIAQKPPVVTITGNTIVLTDNVFNDQVVLMLQGGTITKDSSGNITSYTPPVLGSNEKGKVFKLNAYSSIYNAAGILTGYEKIEYPNCQGTPIAFSSEDGVFRASDYTINSAPANGEAPYSMSVVADLPEVTTPLGELTVTSVAGETVGYTAVTVTPVKAIANSYKYKTGTGIVLPAYGDVIGNDYSDWDGTSEIQATTGQTLVMVEVDGANSALKGGTATVTAKSE